MHIKNLLFATICTLTLCLTATQVQAQLWMFTNPLVGRAIEDSIRRGTQNNGFSFEKQFEDYLPKEMEELSDTKGIKVTVATGNVYMRPSSSSEFGLGPFSGRIFDMIYYNDRVFSTSQDNWERAELFKKYHRNFDIVATQELFDKHQVRQFSNMRSHRLLLGPREDRYLRIKLFGRVVSPGISFGWTSGLGTLVDKRFAVKAHYRYGFGNEGRDLVEKLANKGFQILKVQLDKNPSHYIWVVNTHLHAGEADTRQDQLDQMKKVLSKLTLHPIVILGDFNIKAKRKVTPAKIKRYGGPQSFGGWAGIVFPAVPRFYYEEVGYGYSRMIRTLGNVEDPFRIEKNKTGRNFDTSDKNRNPYGYFTGTDDGNLASMYLLGVPVVIPSGGGPIQTRNVTLSEIDKRPGDFESKQIDYILIRQGLRYKIKVNSVQLEDGTNQLLKDVDTSFLRKLRNKDTNGEFFGEGKLTAFYSDHFGLSAELEFIDSGKPETGGR